MTRQLPAGYDVRSYPTPTDGPVICGQCLQAVRPRDLMPYQGRRMCRNCADAYRESEQQQRTAVQVEAILREHIFKRLDLELLAPVGEREPPDINAVLEAALETFGGPHIVGQRWAEILQRVADRALEDNTGLYQAARLFNDFYRAMSAHYNAFQNRDIERMSLEEAKQARNQLLAEEICKLTREEIQLKIFPLLTAMRNCADYAGDDEFLARLEEGISSIRKHPESGTSDAEAAVDG